MLLVGNQRTVHIHRNLPAEGLIEAVVLRRRGQVLISPDHMGNAHEMIVHHIGEIVGGIPVRLDQNHVVQLRVVHSNIPVNLIAEGGGPGSGIVLADHIGHSRRQLLLHFLLRQGETVLVVNADLLSADDLAALLQALLIAETVVSLALLDQLLGIFQVDPLLLTLALYIGPHAAVLIRALVMHQPSGCQCAVDDVHRPLHIAFLVCVLYPQDKISALMFRDQIGVQRGSQIAHMHPSRGTGGKSCSDSFHVLTPRLKSRGKGGKFYAFL